MTHAFRSFALSLLLLALAAAASADLDGLIADLNLQARVDLPGFSARLSAQFAVPLPQVEVILGQVAAPADAFLCLQLGHLAQKPMDAVTAVYKANKGKGWGVVAQELGIKPGSDEFHAFKDGKYTLTGTPSKKGEGKGEGQGEGQGKGKGKGKGQGQGDGQGQGKGKGQGKH